MSSREDKRTRAEDGPTRLGRRAFLGGLGAAGLALAACGTTGRGLVGGSRRQARVAIIGAGLAGLVACERLRAAGLNPSVYEARASVGGRVVSVLGHGEYRGNPRAIELGGEFIDSQHTRMLALAESLELELHDNEELEGLSGTYWFGGRAHSEANLIEEFEPAGRALLKAREAIGIPIDAIGYDRASEGARRYDRMSLLAFLEEAGVSALGLSALRSAYEAEFGLALEEQSALNFIGMITPEDVARIAGEGGAWEVYGTSDERYKVRGGNAQIPRRLAERHAGRIETSRPLTALTERADGSFTLSFDGGHAVDADLVICTVPFSVLREVDLRVDLPARKKQAIAELGYGTNSKLILPFHRPVWEEAGADGLIFGEGELLMAWAPLFGQGPGPVALTQYRAGAHGAALGTLPVADDAEAFMRAAAAIWPSLPDALRQEMPPLVAAWPRDPWARGSYACYRPGQWTAFGGAEREPVRRLFFAGEHTASEFQGFMEGAVRSGERAAAEVLALLGAGEVIAQGRGAANRFASA